LGLPAIFLGFEDGTLVYFSVPLAKKSVGVKVIQQKFILRLSHAIKWVGFPNVADPENSGSMEAMPDIALCVLT
jgi:hypothetical protein